MRLNAALPHRIDSETVDAAKGILILLVVIGHAANFFNPEPFPFLGVKFFHVAVFLLLPFVYDVKPLTLNLLRDRFIRYYVPYAVFLVGYAVLYLVFMRGIDETGAWFGDLIKALMIGNGRIIDSAAGLSALWFLPAYLTVSLGISLLIGRWRWPLWVLFSVAVALNASVGALPDPVRHLLPMGLVNVAFLFVLGLCLRICFEALPRAYIHKAAPFFLTGFLAFMAASYIFQTYIKFPVMILPTILTPLDWIVHDGIILLAALFLLSTTWLRGIKWLRYFGQKSLQIYLLHLPFVLLPSVIGQRYLYTGPDSVLSWIIFAVLAAMALLCACISAWILDRIPVIKGMIFPRDWKSWIK